MSSKAMRQGVGLHLTSATFLSFWCLQTSFLIFWIAVMSFKSPVDAVAASVWDMVLGSNTLDRSFGLSVIDIGLGLVVLYLCIRWAFTRLPGLIERFCAPGLVVLGWVVAAALYAVTFVLVFFGLLPRGLGGLNAVLWPLGTPVLCLTTKHSVAVWAENEFYSDFLNFMLAAAGVVFIPLTVGTLAGFGLARSGSNLAFWPLLRAPPHSVLVAGFLPVFVNLSEIL